MVEGMYCTSHELSWAFGAFGTPTHVPRGVSRKPHTRHSVRYDLRCISLVRTGMKTQTAADIIVSTSRRGETRMPSANALTRRAFYYALGQSKLRLNAPVAMRDAIFLNFGVKFDTR